MYYAVKNGRNPGIYSTWDECKREVTGFSGAVYKKFKTYEEAESFIGNIEEEIKIKDIDELKDKEIIAYVDGSYRKEDHSYSYGVYLYSEDLEEKYSKRFFDEENAKSRNVSGELKGAIVAMKRGVELGYKKMYLHYDYRGIEDWALGNWKTNLNLTREYKKTYDEVKDKMEVQFIKVDAHTGIYYNELVDKLAKEAK